jgi:hypothetical protein
MGYWTCKWDIGNVSERMPKGIILLNLNYRRFIMSVIDVMELSVSQLFDLQHTLEAVLRFKTRIHVDASIHVDESRDGRVIARAQYYEAGWDYPSYIFLRTADPTMSEMIELFQSLDPETIEKMKGGLS